MSNGEKASAIFNEYNNTNKGEAFVTTGCTNSTLDAVVNYIDLHPKEGQDYIALKFIDSVTKAPITSSISCWFNSSVKTIVTDYQGIAHISGTYDSKVVILVRCDGYVEYNQTYDSLANHSVTTIELVPEPVFENDGIDYMQIEGDGIEHPIFRVCLLYTSPSPRD